MWIAVSIIVLAPLLAVAPLFVILRGSEYVLTRISFGRAPRFLLIAVKSLARNPLRTSLTYLAAFLLVAIVTIVWSAIYVLDRFMQAKANDIKVVITEKWQANGAMPFAYARPLCEGAADPSNPEAVRPDDGMTWQFYFGTVDPEKKTRESLVAFIAIEPSKAATLMDRILDDVPQESSQQSGPKLSHAQDFMAALSRLESNKRGAILGRKVLSQLNKRVGERIKVTGINYKDLDLEFEIVGEFPAGRYNDTAIMNRDYLNDALDVYPRTHSGQKHPLADRSLNFVILQVSDLPAYDSVTGQIDSSGLFENPAVKCETLAAYAVTQLDSYRDIIWGMRWLLSPAILVTLAVVIATSLSISLRERRTEIAVLKVLGYQPAHVLALVLGEAAILGALGGCLSSIVVYQTVNRLMDNSDSFLPVYIPHAAFYWGPVVGALTGLAGSFIPAWTACKVQISQVFARVG
jgi:putative ABC transport system permease protein